MIKKDPRGSGSNKTWTLNAASQTFILQHLSATLPVCWMAARPEGLMLLPIKQGSDAESLGRATNIQSQTGKTSCYLYMQLHPPKYWQNCFFEVGRRNKTCQYMSGYGLL